MPIKNALWYVLWLQRATSPVGTCQQQEVTSRLSSLRIVIGNILACFGPKINGNANVHVHVVRKKFLKRKKLNIVAWTPVSFSFMFCHSECVNMHAL